MKKSDLDYAKFVGLICQNPECKKKFKPLSQKRGRPPKFCCNACKQKKHRLDKKSEKS